MRQLFATGQTVSIAPDSLSGPSTAERFRIVRRHLIENSRAMYHVRGLRDDSQRMVPEDELSAAMPHMFGRNGEPGKIVRLFPDVVRFDRLPA